jgi:hypothetical protein
MNVYLKLEDNVAPFKALVVYPPNHDTKHDVYIYKHDLNLTCSFAKEHPVHGVVFMSGWENYGKTLIPVLKELDKAKLKVMFYCDDDWGDSKLQFYKSLGLKKFNDELSIIMASVILDDAYKSEYHVLVGKYDEENAVPDGFGGVEKISFNQRFITVKGEE